MSDIYQKGGVGSEFYENKGLEDFSANPVTLRGNILRMR